MDLEYRLFYNGNFFLKKVNCIEIRKIKINLIEVKREKYSKRHNKFKL
jgi:hypothetical protein